MPMDVKGSWCLKTSLSPFIVDPGLLKSYSYTFGEYQTWTQHVKLWSCRWLASYFDKFTRHEPEGTGMYFYICPYMFCFRCLYRITLKMQNGSQLIGLLNRVSPNHDMDDSLLEALNPFGNHQKWSPVKQFIFWRGSNHIYIYIWFCLGPWAIFLPKEV